MSGGGDDTPRVRVEADTSAAELRLSALQQRRDDLDAWVDRQIWEADRLAAWARTILGVFAAAVILAVVLAA